MDWLKKATSKATSAIMGNESSGPSDSVSDYSLSSSSNVGIIGELLGLGSSTSAQPISTMGAEGASGPGDGGTKEGRLPVSASAPSGGFTHMGHGGFSRRGSRTSTTQSTPGEAPEVDLTHLSEEERAQIAAVMSRARELQDEDTKRIK